MRPQLSFVAWLVIAAAALPAAAQDRLAEAKTLYDEAMYTQALDILEHDASLRMRAEAHHYRALCLIALGRPDAAERAMADVVIADPFFRPDARATSPRVITMFAATRPRLLPPTIRRGFAEATSLYREGAKARSRERFDEVLRLLDDPALEGDQALADLALVAGAFVELTRAQAAGPAASPIPSEPIAAAASAVPAAPVPAAATAATGGVDAPPVATAPAAALPPAPAVLVPAPQRMPASAPAVPASAVPASAAPVSTAPPSTAPVSAAPAPVTSPAVARIISSALPSVANAPAVAPVAAPATTGAAVPPAADALVVPATPGTFAAPVAIEQTFPRWNPQDASAAGRTYQGSILVNIDPAGRVTAATRVRTIHPAYDPLVLEAARGWLYRPALHNGQPVSSELVVEVTLRPSTS